MDSTIKWQTGEPKEIGHYLVTLKGGYIDVAFYTGECVEYFAGFISENIVAWCNLSEIEPYKEE